MKVEIADLAGKNRCLPSGWYPAEADDFVFHWAQPEEQNSGSTCSDWIQTVLKELREGGGESPFRGIEDIVDVLFACSDGNDDRAIKARALLCSSAKREFISASLRFSDGKKTPPHDTPPPIERSSSLQISRPLNRGKTKFLFAPDAVCDVALEKLGLIESDTRSTINFSSTPKVESHPAGLIVVAGGTGTGKSLYARGIVLRWMMRLAAARYRTVTQRPQFSPPHLVTFEDPIEGWKIYSVGRDGNSKEIDLCAAPGNDIRAGIRITARAKRKDIDTLEHACLHALRQKPAVVYIGECRKSEDWERAVQLGSTGHLVVTTCHASSLIDTFVKLSGTGDQDAESRQSLVSSIRGVMHLRTSPVFNETESSDLGFKTEQTLFHLWRQTNESRSNFVVDGLASLITDNDNILGREEMTRLILSLQAEGHYDSSSPGAAKYEEIIGVAMASSLKMDVRGL